MRKVGGRFLELDERSGLYVDIGDKKATEKTSQALREGQTKIRKKLYNEEIEMARSSALDPDSSSHPSHLHLQREVEVSQEAYLGYSVQVLESLYIADENASDSSMSSDNKMVVASAAAAAAIANNIGTDIAHPPPPTTPSQSAVLNQIAMMKALEQFPGLRPAHQVQQHVQNQQHQLMPTPLPASAYANSVAVARALEQFPGMAPPTQQALPIQQKQYQNQEQQRQQRPSPLAMPPALLSSASTYANSPGAAPLSQQFPPAQLQQNEHMLMSPPPPRFAKRGFEPAITAMTLDQLHAPGRYTNTSSMGISEAGIGGGGGGTARRLGKHAQRI